MLGTLHMLDFNFSLMIYKLGIMTAPHFTCTKIEINITCLRPQVNLGSKI